jgi:hypothetical protein
MPLQLNIQSAKNTEYIVEFELRAAAVAKYTIFSNLV